MHGIDFGIFYNGISGMKKSGIILSESLGKEKRVAAHVQEVVRLGLFS